jgi:hypothetical protein
MKERPILMNAAMVRATLRDEDPKTQTRRLVDKKWQHFAECCPMSESIEIENGEPMDFPGRTPASFVFHNGIPIRDGEWQPVICPYGEIGDRLWIREAWRVGKPFDATAPRDILPPLIERGQGVTVLYEAGGWLSVGPADREEPTYPDDAPMPDWAGKLRPSMFMPRAFSRILLEITGVRVERLNQITCGDLRAEGAPHDRISLNFRWFKDVWAATGGEWDANPWVWVIEFRRITA